METDASTTERMAHPSRLPVAVILEALRRTAIRENLQSWHFMVVEDDEPTGYYLVGNRANGNLYVVGVKRDGTATSDSQTEGVIRLEWMTRGITIGGHQELGKCHTHNQWSVRDKAEPTQPLSCCVAATQTHQQNGGTTEQGTEDTGATS